VDQLLDVPTGGLDAGAIGERRTVDHAHREDPSPGEVRVRRREHDVGLGREVRGEARQIAELLGEVDGVVHHLRELADEQGRTQLRDLRILGFEVRGNRLHEIEIFEHLALDPVVEHLDRHRGPIHKGRSVNLGHRARRERLGFELAVELLHRRAELAFHERDRESGRVRRHRGLQLRELFGDVIADDVRTQAEHLPELDPGRAQLDQRPSQPLSRGEPGELGVDTTIAICYARLDSPVRRRGRPTPRTRTSRAPWRPR
jgi:hypothetical protein